MGFYFFFKYGEDYYGLSSMPAFPPWDVYDFCWPTETTMTSLFSFSETVPSRTFGAPNLYFNVDDNLVMLSDDGLDSGFHMDIAVSNEFSFQFSVRMAQLPADFSDTLNRRFFVAAYNRYGKMAGILLSENEGIALAQTGDGAYAKIMDSADLFEESATDFYVFRVTIDPATNRGNLYITREDLLPIIGHQLRFTFALMDSPTGMTDKTVVEVLGTAGDPTEIVMSCWKLATSQVYTNRRPIAVPGSDQTVILGSYAGFDGRDSYDPDPADTIMKWWWTMPVVPDNSAIRVVGSGTTPADPTGYTNIINGAAGDFNGLVEGDVVYVGTSWSWIKYVASTYVVVTDSVFPAGTSVDWVGIPQSSWGGAYVSGVVRDVLDATNTPPLTPPDGGLYLVTAGAVGAWVGMEDRLALWNGSSWSFEVPDDNDTLFVTSTNTSMRYVGTLPTGWWIVDDPLPWEIDHWSGRESPIGTFLPDVNGMYSAQLIVRDNGDPELNSEPSVALLNVNVSSVALGFTPELGWIWNYLPDFWELVGDKEKVTTIWSGFAQVAAGLMLELWQHDYAKALLDIQRVFQKRWLHYATVYPEPNYESLPATINVDVDLAGYSAAPGTNEYSYDTGVVLADITDAYLLVLGGVGYRISRITNTAIITKDPMPTTDRPKDWCVKPTVKSRASDFSYERVQAGDTAVFEIVRSTDHTAFDVEAYIYGARIDMLSFDASFVTGYVNDDDYVVRFKSVRRRSALRLNNYIVDVPRLQEVIKLSVAGAPTPLFQNLNYRIEEEQDLDRTINTMRFTDFWFPVVATEYDGDTTAGTNLFDSPSSDFTALFDTDISNYVLDTPTGRYRLYQVLSATQLELEADAVPPMGPFEWTIRRIDTPPDYLWAEVTYVDNRPTIEANFGRLVDFRVEDLATRTDDLDYLSAVRGLWYTYWFGPTPYNIRIGSQILLGLPFAEQRGTITDINTAFDSEHTRVLVRDYNNQSIIRSYFFPTILGVEENPATGVPYIIGDDIEQFAPISKGVEIADWVSDADWFGYLLGAGDFYEIWKVHTFGVYVDAEAFSLTNLQFVMNYILRIKPTYTYPLFVVRADFQEIVTIDDAQVMGPVIPASPYNQLPNTWIYPTPLNWADSPWESRVVRVAPPTFDAAQRWPTGRFVGPTRYVESGNLHLTDTPGRVPDVWTGAWPEGAGTHAATRAEGAHVLDDTDESGHCIHRLDADTFAVNVATDGDMEAVGVAAWPDVPGAGPTTKVKSAFGGSQVLEISDVLADKGCYQDFPSLIDAGFQTAVKCRVYVLTGQAHFVLYDQDGSLIAEARFAPVPSGWQDVVLHHWAVADDVNAVRFEMLTGPAGGHFYVDDVEMYEKAVPWDQWGLDRMYGGRTGGYTVGGSPDEKVTFQITMAVP